MQIYYQADDLTFRIIEVGGKYGFLVTRGKKADYLPLLKVDFIFKSYKEAHESLEGILVRMERFFVASTSTYSEIELQTVLNNDLIARIMESLTEGMAVTTWHQRGESISVSESDQQLLEQLAVVEI
jgi:hypothetical protein